MRNIRLLLSYDGTDFNGWQIQAAGRTVQGLLEAALTELHGERIPIHAAGRTDSGVHAAGQVVNFRTEHPSLPTEKFREALNAQLPRDVRVHESREAPPEFHARYSARRREYRYYLLPAAVAPGYQQRYCHRISRRPDLQLLNRMVAPLVGEQDFATFAATRSVEENTVRRVYAASFFPSGPYLCFRIVANGFLWKMVRSIIGTTLALAGEDRPVAAFRDALQAGDRRRAGTTAPARGLFLHHVAYE